LRVESVVSRVSGLAEDLVLEETLVLGRERVPGPGFRV